MLKSGDEIAVKQLYSIYLQQIKYIGKKSFYCSSTVLVKSGHKDHIQRHLCKSCRKRFINRKIVDTEALWRDYVFGKQTIFQLSQRYRISQSTVGNKLDSIRVLCIISSSKNVVILMDTTYSKY